MMENDKNTPNEAEPVNNDSANMLQGMIGDEWPGLLLLLILILMLATEEMPFGIEENPEITDSQLDISEITY